MSLINGVVIGLVTAVNDNGMIKVKYPWLDDPETDWIRIATTMAGSDRGTFFMPEVDDEVLVAFEHGFTDHPYVVGFLWNGKDKPPKDDKNVRRIKTKSGHIVEFDDNASREKITIKSKGGHVVELDDSLVQEKIKILSNSNQSVELNDVLKCITVKTGGNEVKLDMAGKVSVTAMISIDLTAPSIALNATNITFGSMASLNPASLLITTPTVVMSGILKTPVITVDGLGQFGTVVSGAYNPGVPGNLYGL